MTVLNNENYKVKVGLEVHRQLDTTHKLFCNCPTLLTEEKSEYRFLRRLRPTQSELGQVDQAALFEFHRGKGIMYEADHNTSCLVEMDEEPPGSIDREAVEVCLTASLLVHAKLVDEVHVMRKIVIDGSNTTGFQRTCVIALNGEIQVDGSTIPIDQISLEEDAARKTSQDRTNVGYRIDRLGIPLIEVTTAPVLHSPADVEKVALAIGNVLRATRKVKRGLGSVRQDLNISTPNGALVEIKGVQDLELLSKAVELEINRQNILIQIREELKQKGLAKEEFREEFVDLTEIFKFTKARVLKDALSKHGAVLGVKLPRCNGLLGRELGIAGLRFGTELAGRAIFMGVGGIFHSDELPAYGIVDNELTQVKQKLNVNSSDAFVLVADELVKATDALRAVIERSIQALIGVPEETRNAMADGSSRFIRPRPGASRMYPETDVPSTPMDKNWIERLRTNLPKTQAQMIASFIQKFSLNQKLAKQLVDSEYLELFEEVTSKMKMIQPSFVATMLTETCKSLERDGIPVHLIENQKMQSIFELIGCGVLTKEAMPELIKWQAKNLQASPTVGIKELGLSLLSKPEVEDIINRHFEKNKNLVAEKGIDAFPSLMGSVMSELRGKADPKVVSQILKNRLESKS